MCAQESSTPDYTIGFSEGILQFYWQYTAEANAGYLLPYLRPGLRVLDFGCGPGTISTGLAKAVSPGEMHGVDMEESQIDMARTFAMSRGQSNARFHVGDVTDMPFEDGYFDVAHCHKVLMHVPDTSAVLAEVKRVLKPGGIIGCREMICDASFTHPDFDIIRRAWDMFEALVSFDDGHPQMGKDLKNRMVEAGFCNVKASASFDAYSAPDDIEFIHGLVAQWFLSSAITDTAIRYGVATERLCQDIQAAYDKWRVHPGAFIGVAYGEAVASKPIS